MDWTSWIGFVGVALFVTFTPGPAVLMAISNSLSVGPRLAMVGSLGNAVGLLAVSAATTAGLGVLLRTSAQAFLVVKLLGACYLIYLGVKQWRQGDQGLSIASGEPAASAAPILSRRALFGRGIVVALTNPKAILFFAALFPQFMNHPESAARDFAVLTVTFSGCAVLAHAFYVVLARALRRGLSSSRRVRALNRIFGACFVGLGVSLLGWRGRVAAG
ncbi:lysine transporter LysE [Roseateles aquatilis]|uniref:Lysine transporter LysE n=1 Tax=Roseateles aquatilis TaxID=431061 RepID=A0A246IZR0_9BURK|nr:LysE family translocator [Roseateles aquatilis]OWQ85702.1 lysine transporter LysE [Roseateles aquatilis]